MFLVSEWRHIYILCIIIYYISYIIIVLLYIIKLYILIFIRKKGEVLVFLVSEWRHGLGCGPRSFLSSNLAAQPVHSVQERDVFVTFAKSICQWPKCIVKCIDFHWEKNFWIPQSNMFILASIKRNCLDMTYMFTCTCYM